jgi:hypothetical protein
MYERDDRHANVRAQRRQNGARGPASSGAHDEQTEVVLVDAGATPRRVAAVLESFMGISIPDPEALRGAVPLVLYREIDRWTAEDIILRLDFAGAVVDHRPARRKRARFRFRLAA